MRIRALAALVLAGTVFIPATRADPVSSRLGSVQVPPEARREYVNSVEDLRDHFQSHIQRVEALGLEILQREPEQFRLLTPELVSEFLRVHDQAKLDDSAEFMAKHGVDPGHSLLERLYDIYALGYEAIPPEGKETIRQLNAADKGVAHDFFKRKGWVDSQGNLKPIALQLLRVERLADVVDRNRDPVAREEFRLKERRPLSDFIKDPKDLAIAERLGEDYGTLVRGRTYVDYQIGQRLIRACLGQGFQRLLPQLIH